MLEEGIESDVTIVTAENNEIDCHKCLLDVNLLRQVIFFSFEQKLKNL